MEADYFKSYSLIVPIMCHDEHNYLAAPPIHQSKDGGQEVDGLNEEQDNWIWADVSRGRRN